MPAESPTRSTSRRRRGRDDQAGQASLEYAGVLAIVAAVCLVTASVTGGGAIANAVVRGIERALCRVTGGDCLATELAACTVRSRETGGRIGVKLTFVKLGGSLSLLREELSDGTIDVTLIDGTDAAPTAALGASGGVRLGGDRVGGGLITQAELLVRLGRRRIWHRPDAASADRLIRDIGEHVAANVGERAIPVIGTGVRRLAHAVGLDGDALPTPDVSGVSAGVEGAIDAELGGIVAARAGFEASLGGTRDHATGRRTLVLAIEGEAAVTLSEAAGGAGLTRRGGPTVSLTYDRRGEPLELGVAVAGTAGGDFGLDLPQRSAGDDADRVEVSARLDLRRDENRVVYERLLGALAPSRAASLPRAVAALADRVVRASRRDVVRYATTDTGYGADAEAAAGARFGGAVEVSQSTAELRDAWTRPAGGAWEQRTDCLAPRSTT